MTYDLPLKWVALTLAVLYLLKGIVGLTQTEKVRAFALGAARHFGLGVILMIIAMVWWSLLLINIDLAEFSPWRWPFLFFCIGTGVATILYLPEYLTARAVGILLLLATELLLSATFPVLHPARHLVTVMGYLMAIAGMFFVSTPHTYRDLNLFLLKTPERAKMVYFGHIGMGLILMVLAFQFY